MDLLEKYYNKFNEDKRLLSRHGQVEFFVAMLKSKTIVAKQGNALNLKFKDDSFDIALLFGPTYHLFSHEDKLKAINEAKRVVRKGGGMLIMYLTNEYAVITYAIKE